MQFYLAPLEGVTGHIFRNAIYDFYGEHIDKYFIPFLEPHQKRAFHARELKEILPENNRGNVVPQILTKSAEDFLFLEEELLSYGYEEINLNLGCPSGTVVAKGRGAAMLSDICALDEFLGTIFKGTKARISIKTRIGITSPEEFFAILEIFNQYPVKELIIHPRVQKELYRGKPHMETFSYAIEHSQIPLCYNGDLTSLKGYQKALQEFSGQIDEEKSIQPRTLERGQIKKAPVTAVMIGRGILQNPALFDELAKGKALPKDYEKLCAFHDRLLTDYLDELKDEKNVLFKMKEIWNFWGMQYPDSKSLLKPVNKAQHLTEYQVVAKRLLRSEYAK